MKRILKVLFFLVIIFNLVLSAWLVLHHDLQFTSEIARDFFLLDEMAKKKIILIGPSSTTGLFHGPLWTYVNYPAYLIGRGNPEAVAWGWIAMVIAFLISGFYIARNLFNKTTAYFYVLMISVYSVFHGGGLYNPHGAMFVIPAFFYFLIRYMQTQKLKYLIIHVLLAGVLIQFQMAIGIPFFILSFFYAVYVCVKAKKKKYLLSYLLIILTLSNFILFDLRHEFLNTKLVLHFMTAAGRDNPNIISMFYQRIKFMTTGVEFIRADPGYRDMVVFIIFSIFTFFQLKDKKFKAIYLSFLYFYFGFLVLSNLNSGGLLYFYLFPLFPFVFLIFSSFVTSRYSKIFIAIFFIIFLFNIQSAMGDTIDASKRFIGQSNNSWLFYRNVSSKIFTGEEKEFGYYVYSPEVLAYQGKYAMLFQTKQSSKKTHYFQKKPITYLLIAPPPQGNPYMKDEWWKINLLHIDRKPDSTINFVNGYKIEKYKLSEEEIKVPVEKNIDPGLTFR
ncbi:MAG: hypothetical protein Q8P80_02435 [Candidatus Levybacteria bacterium]|nr:hypothetical protein [Candidatus Levybacteria bacterium]